MPLPLLSIQNLSISFVGEQGINHAIKNISLNIYKGEIVAMVGESGSGKSVTSLSILKLLPTPPAQMEGGQILYSEDGASTIDLIGADNEVLRHIRGNKISIIF